MWDAVPSNAKRALARSRHLFLELDLTRHSTVRALSACQLLPEGRHLSQVLPQDVYLRLRLYLVSYAKRQLLNMQHNKPQTKKNLDKVVVDFFKRQA